MSQDRAPEPDKEARDRSHSNLEGAQDPAAHEPSQAQIEAENTEARPSDVQDLLFREAAVIAQNLRESGTRR